MCRAPGRGERMVVGEYTISPSHWLKNATIMNINLVISHGNVFKFDQVTRKILIY